MRTLPFLAAPGALMVVVSCTTEHAATAPEESGSFSFVVIGDTPYSQDDEAMLTEAVPRVKAGNYPFVIHIGDYKGGLAPCTPETDDRFAALLGSLAPTPVVYTPGDNEWADCDRHIDPATGKPVSELARLKTIRARFFASPPRARKSFEFERQGMQVENATWRFGGARFATLHVVGTSNGRDWVVGDPLGEAAAAADARDAANLEWLAHVERLASAENAKAIVIAMQADVTVEAGSAIPACKGAADHDVRCDAFSDLRAALRDAATRLAKPLLVIHGDTSPFTLDSSFAGAESPYLQRLNAAGDAGIGATGTSYGVRDMTFVTIDPEAENPFAARGFLTGATPQRQGAASP